MFSRIPNLRIIKSFWRNFPFFLLEQGKISLLKSKMLPTVYFQKKTLCSSFKRKQDILYVKKIVDSWRFGIREGHGQVRYYDILGWKSTIFFFNWQSKNYYHPKIIVISLQNNMNNVTKYHPGRHKDFIHYWWVQLWNI